jgi:hypothetical protein
LCRLGPTIALHYLRQIGAGESAFETVMTTLDRVVFLRWDVASPILLLLSLLFFGFRVPDRIRECCLCVRTDLFIPTDPLDKYRWDGRKIMKDNGHELSEPREDYGRGLDGRPSEMNSELLREVANV